MMENKNDKFNRLTAERDELRERIRRAATRRDDKDPQLEADVLRLAVVDHVLGVLLETLRTPATE